MAGPFPGMDPYIEAQGNWQDFHNRLIAEMCNVLGIRLPGAYVARVDERIEVVGFGEEAGRAYRPDVLLAHREDQGGARGPSPRVAGSGGGGGLATIEPWLAEVSARDPEEIRVSWLEIRRLPDLELVTVIEVLSPVNKAGPSRQSYVEKRDDLHARRVNLVEIDLLLGGLRVPMKPPLDRGDYFAVVARGARLPVAEVYGWTVRDPLPTLPVPLKEPDADVAIELGELVGRVYDLGRYGRTLRYDEPLPEGLPLRSDDREWAQSRALVP